MRIWEVIKLAAADVYEKWDKTASKLFAWLKGGDAK